VQAHFVTSSHLLLKAWDAISSRDEDVVPHMGNGLFWKVREELDGMVVVFEINNDFDLYQKLVSSSDLKEKNNFHRFEFLCTKKIPEFSVNGSAVSLFIDNLDELDELKSKVHLLLPLSLFLWFLFEKLQSEHNRLIEILNFLCGPHDKICATSLERHFGKDHG